MTRARPLLDRLLEKIEKDESSGCWNFMGSLDPSGYGCIKTGDGNRNTKAHRAAFRLLKGEIPEGRVIDHLCKNRRCCNPDHLEAVPFLINVRRGEATAVAADMRETHCPRGHLLSDENSEPYKASNGRTYMRCITCARESTRRWRASRKNTDALQSLSSP